MSYKKNKLWGCLTTPERVERLARRYPHFYANPRYCLVISKSRPRDMVEMTEEFIAVLTERDWKWISEEAEIIRAEEETEYYDDFQVFQNDFIERFEKELRIKREEMSNGDEETSGNPTE